MQIDKYFSTPYEGYFVSKDGEVVSFRKQEPTGQQGREP